MLTIFPFLKFFYFLREQLERKQLNNLEASRRPERVGILLGLCLVTKFLSPNFTIYLSHQIYWPCLVKMHVFTVASLTKILE